MPKETALCSLITTVHQQRKISSSNNLTQSNNLEAQPIETFPYLTCVQTKKVKKPTWQWKNPIIYKATTPQVEGTET